MSCWEGKGRGFFRHASWVTSALACALLFAGSRTAWAGHITRVGPDRISIRAEAVPLDRLLLELITIVPLEILGVDPKIEHLPVTVTLEDIPVAEGLPLLLKEAGLEFAVGGLKGQPARVWIGSLPDARLLAEAFSAPAGQARGIDAAKWTALPLEERRRLRQERLQDAAGRGAAPNGPAPAENAGEVVTGTNDSHSTLVTDEYTMEAESVTYHDPTFVPYKNRPEVKARRMAIDVTKIP
jgi:hypothetical protein